MLVGLRNKTVNIEFFKFYKQIDFLHRKCDGLSNERKKLLSRLSVVFKIQIRRKLIHFVKRKVENDENE